MSKKILNQIFTTDTLYYILNTPILNKHNADIMFDFMCYSDYLNDKPMQVGECFSLNNTSTDKVLDLRYDRNGLINELQMDKLCLSSELHQYLKKNLINIEFCILDITMYIDERYWGTADIYLTGFVTFNLKNEKHNKTFLFNILQEVLDEYTVKYKVFQMDEVVDYGLDVNIKCKSEFNGSPILFLHYPKNSIIYKGVTYSSLNELIPSAKPLLNNDELQMILQSVINAPTNNQLLYNFANYYDDIDTCINVGDNCVIYNTTVDNIFGLCYDNIDVSVVELDKANLSSEIKNKLFKQLVKIQFHFVEIKVDEDMDCWGKATIDLSCFVEFEFKNTTKTYFVKMTQEVDETKTIKYTIDTMTENFNWDMSVNVKHESELNGAVVKFLHYPKNAVWCKNKFYASLDELVSEIAK